MAAGTPDLVLESVGTVAFAVSGGAVAVRAGMDWLGVAVLAVVTADLRWRPAGGGPVDRDRGRARAAAAGDPVLLVAAADPGPGMTAGQAGLAT